MPLNRLCTCAYWMCSTSSRLRSSAAHKHTHITEKDLFPDFPFEKRNGIAFLPKGLHSQEVEETAWSLFEMRGIHMGCSERAWEIQSV